jgi:tRNA threonylcarbamoyladenosine biosynthesis protein TsaB
MKILALELSTARGSLAWLDGDLDLLVREWPNDRKNSGAFFENLEKITKKFGPSGKIVVGLGPGSYAGTRIAIAAAIGLQAASNAPLVGLPSICAIESADAAYCVIGDARRHSFFFAEIREHEIIEGPNLLREEELKSRLATIEQEMPIFCSESLPQFPSAVIRHPSAQLLARLAQDSNPSFKLPPLEPMYLREPHITTPRTAGRSAIAP